MNASETFVRALEAEGVTYLFGIPGEENLDLLEALRTSRIRLILTRHEQASLKSFKRTRAGAILSSPLRIAGSNAAKQILSAQYAAVPSRCPQPDRA